MPQPGTQRIPVLRRNQAFTFMVKPGIALQERVPRRVRRGDSPMLQFEFTRLQKKKPVPVHWAWRELQALCRREPL